MYLGLGAVCVAIGVGLFVYWLVGAPGTINGVGALLAVAGALSLMGAYVLLDTLGSWLELHDDGTFVFGGALGRKSHRASDFAAFRRREANGFPYYELLDARGRVRLRPGIGFGPLEEVDAWFAARLEDLDERDWTEGLATLERERASAAATSEAFPELPTAHRRVRALERGGLVAAGAFVAIHLRAFRHDVRSLTIGLAVLCWGLLVALCWVTTRYRRVLELNRTKVSPFPEVGRGLVTPLLFALLAMRGPELIHWSSLGVAASGFALLLFVVLARVRLPEGRRRWEALVFAGLLALAGGYGMAYSLNTTFDFTSPRRASPARVVSSRTSSGEHPQYWLAVRPWGPRDEAHELQVSRKDLVAMPPGTPLRITVARGLLGAPWVVRMEAEPIPSAKQPRAN